MYIETHQVYISTIKSVNSCSEFPNSDPCSSGDTRLWGGKTEYEGNIEICTDHGVWSAVCDVDWGSATAVVACRQLNYANSSKQTSY